MDRELAMTTLVLRLLILLLCRNTFKGGGGVHLPGVSVGTTVCCGEGIGECRTGGREGGGGG